MGARPLEKVVDEVEQSRVRPLQVLEDEHGRVLLGEPLEEEAPGSEKILALCGGLLGKAEQLRQPRLHPGALVRIEQVPLERLVELPRRDLGRLLLGDPGAHAHHLRERPVRDAFAVGETAAAVPVDVADQAIDVTLELGREPGLADPGDPEDRDEAGLSLVARGMEEIFDQAHLALAADERCLEAGRAPLAAAGGDHSRRVPQRHRLGLALELVLARVLVGDRCLARAPCSLSDEDGSGLRGRLHPRSGVDEVPCNHALALGPDRDGRLARDHADAHRELGRADLASERSHDLDELEARAHGPLRVVLACDGCAPDGHDRVADELLDGAAVALDHTADRVEIAREELPDLFGVAVLGERREADEVAEQDGHEPPLRLRGRCGCRRFAMQPDAALAAEAVVCLIRRAARRTGQGELGAAIGAELSARAVLCAAR